jgi:magnesium transporter
MANPLFGPEVRMMLEEENHVGLKAFCESIHPITVAETLDEHDFAVVDVWRVLSHTGAAEQAAIFEYFPASWQLRLVEGAGRDQMAKLIERMSHDDRVDLLRRLSPRVADGLLRLVDEADRRDIATLFRYGENTVGAIMTTDYAWLPDTLTVGQALDRLRQQAPDRETIYYVYILDESTRRLIGIISLRDLILSDRQVALRDLMERDIFALKASDDREVAAEQLARTDFLALPVIDEERRLVGIITHDDVIDVITQEATEDLQRQAAVGPIADNYLEAGFFTIWKRRAFWLACLFGAELLTFTAMAQFEDALSAIMVLSLFIPLCISTGGNSGSQAATLITRSLALGHIRVGDWLRVFRHELLMGVVLGLTLGVIALARGFLTSEDLRSDIRTRAEPFEARIAGDGPLQRDAEGRYLIPAGASQTLTLPVRRDTRVTVPANAEVVRVAGVDGSAETYRFPAQCVTRVETVSRWGLALVIAQSVAAICMWGTLVGAMFPLILRKVGIDPAIASSPFVATFVDVTGILIYFSVARLFLL